MTTASASRKRLHRARRKAGQAVFPLVVDEVEMIETLVMTGWLRAEDADDRRKIEAAFRAAWMTVKVLPRDASRHGSVGLCIVGANHEELDR